jgi:hypothetical protein
MSPHATPARRPARRIARLAALAGGTAALGLAGLALPAGAATSASMPDLSVALTSPGFAPIDKGADGTGAGIATFTATVTNHGSATAVSNRIVLPKPAASTHGWTSLNLTNVVDIAPYNGMMALNLNDLAPGASASVTWQYSIFESTGFVATQTASVNSGSVESSTANNTASATTTVGNPTATTVKQSSTTSVYGQAVTFTVQAIDTYHHISYAQQSYDLSVDGVHTKLDAGNAAAATYTTSTLTAGVHALKADFAGFFVQTIGGPVNYGMLPSSGTVSHTVVKANTSLSPSAPNLAFVGRQFFVTVRPGVIAPGGGTPTGAITVTGPDGTFSAPIVSGVAQVPYTAWTGGLRNLTVNYAGSSNFNGSSATVSLQVS